MDDDSNRYDKYHELGSVRFYLDSYSINYEEACYILLKVVEQAIRDYCFLEWSNIPYKRWHWETAKDFIFEDDYFVAWGDLELNLGRICEILAYTEKSYMDVDWVRRKTKEKYEAEKRKRENK
jgi:hypothetical protein